MKKTLTNSLLIVGLVCGAWAENYVSPKKHVIVADSRSWVITEMPSSGTLLEVVNLKHENDNLHVNLRIIALEPAFDVETPIFVDSVRKGLEAAGMEITNQNTGEFQGHKAIYVYARKPTEVLDSDGVVYTNVVSISFFIDDKTFVTLSFGSGEEKILEHPDVEALTENLILRS